MQKQLTLLKQHLSKSKNLLLIALSLAISVANAQVTKVDPARLVKPAGSANKFLLTNGSTATTWGDASAVLVAGTGISISGNTVSVATGWKTDSIWAKAPGGTYPFTRITDPVFRYAPVGVNTNDTTGYVNIKRTAESAKPGLVLTYGDASTNGFNFLSVRPTGQTGNGSLGNFNFWAQNFEGVNLPNSSRANHVWRFGYNTGGAGGRIISTDADLHIAFESNFYNFGLDGIKRRTWEWHVESQDTQGVVHRPISIAGAHNGREGGIGFNSDGVYFSRYNSGDPWLQANRFSRIWAYRDSMEIIFDKNGIGGGGIKQRNAANSTYINLIHADGDNQVYLGGGGFSRVTAEQHFRVTGSGLLSNESGLLIVGNSTYPTRLAIEHSSAPLLTLIRTGATYNTTFGISGTNLYMESSSGTTPIQVDLAAPSSSLQITSSGKIGFGIFNPQANGHFYTSSGASTKMIRLENSSGHNDIYRVSASPESAVTATAGSIALSDISGVGKLWVKQSGGGDTGWNQIMATDATASADQIAYWTGSNIQGGSNFLVWKPTQKRLGIGTALPRDAVSIMGSNAGISFLNTSNPVPYAGIKYDQAGDRFGFMRNDGADSLNTWAIAVMRETGLVGIGTASPATRLHVVGNTRSDGTITAQGTGTGTGSPMLELNNTTASTGKNWQFLSANGGGLSIGNATAGDAIGIVGATGAVTIYNTLTLPTVSGTATTITGRTSGGVVTDVAIGSGLSLSGGTLSASGGSASSLQAVTDVGNKTTRSMRSDSLMWVRGTESTLTAFRLTNTTASTGDTYTFQPRNTGELRLTGGSTMRSRWLGSSFFQNGTGFFGPAVSTIDGGKVLGTDSIAFDIYSSIENKLANTASGAYFIAKTPSGGGDPGMIFTAGSQSYHAGIDNSTDDFYIGLGTQPGTTPVVKISTDYTVTATGSVSNTNTVADRLIITTNSTGTPSNNFGGGILFRAESSTTNDRDQAQVQGYWPTVSDGARSGGVKIRGSVSGTMTDILTINSSQMTIPASYVIGGGSTALTLGNAGAVITLNTTSTTAGAISLTSSGLVSGGGVRIGQTAYTSTTLAKSALLFDDSYAAASGSGTFTAIAVNNTINMTSTATGIQRGVYVRPTLTSLVSTGAYYAFSTNVNNSRSYAFLQDGSTARNLFAGQTSIKTGSAPTANLDIGAGTTSANTAPIKIALGSLMSSVEAGAIEYDGFRLYHTLGTNIRYIVPACVFTASESSTVANTTTETTILGTGVGTKTIPSNTLPTGRTVRVKGGGVYSTPSTPGTITVRVKLGGATIATATTTALAASASNKEFSFEVNITIQSIGGSGTAAVDGVFEYYSAAGVHTFEALNNGGSVATLATNASNPVDVTVQWDSASASKTLTANIGTVEFIN